jgi:threonine dehydrogenase-like Zn-dependent dehydrogenase
VLPTAWQAVAYADIPDGGSVSPCSAWVPSATWPRIADHLGYRVIAVDLVPERLARVAQRGIHTIDLSRLDTPLGDAIRDLTDGRGTDSVIDAVGMEAHGSPAARLAQRAAGVLPDALGKRLMQTVGVDRLSALYSAIDIVRGGGTISLIGVYGGMADPLPMLTLFDKQVTLRMGQANVKKWVDDIMPLLTDDDPLGVDTFATHVLPLDEAPHAYEIFQKKQDGAVKVMLRP